MPPHQAPCLLDLILGAFHRLEKRVAASGHQQQQSIAWPAERRHQLGAVLYGKPARRAGTGITSRPPRVSRALAASAACSRAGRTARTAATAASWPSLIA